MTRGFFELNGPASVAIRHRGEDLAMAVAYTWLNKDFSAQEEFLNRILKMSVDGLGIMIAAEVYTKARLHGLRPGTLREDVEVTTSWEMPVSGTPEERGHACHNVAVITDLWTGYATGNVEQMMRAKAEMFELRLPQVRELLRIMAYDASRAIDQFAIWRAGGADMIDDYRREVPIENAFPPPAAAQGGVTGG